MPSRLFPWLKPFSYTMKYAGLSLLLSLLVIAQQPASPRVGTSQPPATSRIDSESVLKDVSVQLPPTARLGAFQVDAEDARIEAQTVAVPRGSYVVALLAEKGIRQDATALSLIYDLNPQLEDIRQIVAGEKLVLPAVEGPDVLDQALDKGYRVSLFRSQPAVQALNVKKNELGELKNSISVADTQRFTSPEVKADAVKTLDNALAALEILGDPNRVVSRKVREQAAADTEAITRILSPATGAGLTVSREDIARAGRYRENLAALAQEVRAGGSGLVRTEIKTIQEDKLRVWYAPVGKRDDKRHCSDLSTPTVEAIARGEYVFWATRGDQTVTDEVERKIRKDTKDIPVELKVIK